MKSEKPNFVFFFPDEMRASSVSCYGNDVVKMPNFDAMARDGVKFDNCIVQNPVCSPSRCSLMTGNYVHNLGHRTLWHLLRPHEPSLFRYLKDSGYDIGWYGKNDLYSKEYLEEICDDIDEKRNGYRQRPTKKAGQVQGGDNPYKEGDPMYYSFLYDPIEQKDDEILMEEDIARGVDFLKERREGDNPFMLFLPIGMPHPPYNALEEFHNMYDPDLLLEELKKIKDTKGSPSFMSLIRKYRNLDELDLKTLAKIYAVYLGMNSYVDLMLGKILETLDKTGLSENTVVIVSSDHGDWAGNYGLVEKWPNAMDDDLIRVPLLIRAPENKSGYSVKEQVELFDIMATVLDLAGIEAGHTHFSHSLVPQLHGSPGDKDRIVFCEGGYDVHEPHCFEWFPRGEGNASLMDPSNIYYPKALQQEEEPESVCRTTMLRSLDYKLIMRSSGENELYNLKEDPRELNNIYGDLESQKVRLDLERKMLEWYIHTSDTVPFEDDYRNF